MANVGTSTVAYATQQPTGSLVFVASDGTACVLWCNGTNQLLSYASPPYTSWTSATLVTGTYMVLGGEFQAGSDNINTVSGGTGTARPTYRLLTKIGSTWTVGSGIQISTTAAGTQAVGNVMNYCGQDPQGRHWIVCGAASTYLASRALYSPANNPTGTWTQHISTTQTGDVNQPAGDLIGNYLLKTYWNGTTIQYHRADVSASAIGAWSTAATIPNLTGSPNASSRVTFKAISTTQGLLVYSTGSGIYAQTYTPGTDTFSAAVQLSSGANDRHPTIATDGTGKAWVVWCSYAAANSYALVYKKWDGDAWDTGATMLVASGTNIANPSAGYGNQTVGITYTVGTANPYTIGWTTFPTLVTSTRTVPAHAALSALNWFSAGWSYQKTLTIPHTQVIGGSDLVNFPVLVTFTDNDLKLAPTGKIQNASGYDLIFVSADGVTQLDHELEKYDGTAGTITAWVRIPLLSASIDTLLSCTFGNTRITTSQENKTGVWDASYQGVYHLGDGSTLSMADATDRYPGTNNGATATAGQISGAADFNGTSAYITSGLPLGGLTALSIEFWGKLNSLSGSYDQWISADETMSTHNGINVYYDVTSGGLVGVIGNGTTAGYSMVTPALGTATWFYAVFTYDGANIATYFNGAFIGQLPQTGAIGTPGSPLTLGAISVHTYGWLPGVLDEVRFSPGMARSAGWIGTSYANQHTPASFLSAGATSSLLTIKTRTASASAALATAPVTPVGPTGSWSLAWSDEFNDTTGMSGPVNGLAASKWNSGWFYGPTALGVGNTTQVTNPVNAETIAYLGPASIIFPGDSAVHLRLQAGVDNGGALNGRVLEGALISTAGLLAVNPAGVPVSTSAPDLRPYTINGPMTIEFRARFPGPNASAGGYWPIFWSVNAGCYYSPVIDGTAWPGGNSYNEEIDFAEIWSGGSLGSVIDFNLHAISSYANAARGSAIPTSMQSIDFSLAYHTFTYQLTSSTITAWVDGVLDTNITPTVAEMSAQWTYPQYLIFFFQAYAGAVYPTTAAGTPNDFMIDYLRIFIPMSSKAIPASVALSTTPSRTIPVSSTLSMTRTRTSGTSGSVLATFLRTAGATVSLLIEKSRTSGTSVSLSLEKSRTAGATASLLIEKTRTSAGSAPLMREASRLMTLSVSLSANRTIPATVILVAVGIRTIGATTTLATEKSRSLGASLSLLSTQARNSTSSAAFMLQASRTSGVTASISVIRVIPASAALFITRVIPASWPASLLDQSRTITSTVALGITRRNTAGSDTALLLEKTRGTISISSALSRSGVRTLGASVSLFITRSIPASVILGNMNAARILAVTSPFLLEKTRTIGVSTPVLDQATRTIGISLALISTQARPSITGTLALSLTVDRAISGVTVSLSSLSTKTRTLGANTSLSGGSRSLPVTGSIAVVKTNTALIDTALSQEKARPAVAASAIFYLIISRNVTSTVPLLLEKNRQVTSSASFFATFTRSCASTASLQGGVTRILTTSVALIFTGERAFLNDVSLSVLKTRTMTADSTLALEEARAGIAASGALSLTVSRSIASTVALLGEKSRQVTSTVSLTIPVTHTLTSTVALQGEQARGIAASSALLEGLNMHTIESSTALSLEKVRAGIGASGAMLATMQRTVGGQAALLVTRTRSIAASGTYLAERSRAVPSTVALLLPGSIAHTIPVGAALIGTTSRVIPCAVDLEIRRVMPCTVAFSQGRTRDIPAASSLTSGRDRYISCAVALSHAGARVMSTSVVFVRIIPNANVEVRSGRVAVLVKGGMRE